jgi:hypothetical protein
MFELIKKVYRLFGCFIDDYLKDLNDRINEERKPFLKDYIIVVIYLLNVIKYSVLLIKDFDYETRVLLYDIPMFLGGVQKYNTIVFLLGSLLGPYLHKMLYLTTGNSKKLFDWTKIFLLSKNYDPSRELSPDVNEFKICDKFISRSSFVYWISNLLQYSYGNFYLLFLFFKKIYENILFPSCKPIIIFVKLS